VDAGTVAFGAFRSGSFMSAHCLVTLEGFPTVFATV
jgi:hypothetical protein